MKSKTLVAALAALLAFVGVAYAGAPSDLQATGEFDFYVFTLSWSPGFCDTGGANKSPDQCAVGSGQGFVVHGLWPDNLYRDDPANCGSAGYIPGAALAQTRGLYPNPGLARYEYAKHGTCTGLDAEHYFSAVKYLREQFTIPESLKAPTETLSLSPRDIEEAFMAVNDNLKPENMAVTCARGELVDVRFCVSKSLGAFVDCPKVAGHTCHSASIRVAPLR